MASVCGGSALWPLAGAHRGGNRRRSERDDVVGMRERAQWASTIAFAMQMFLHNLLVP
jgi:hypothetical protein